jgi:hypothetical protein
MDDYLFDDINWPEDEELEICQKRRRSLSVSSNRGSEIELCRKPSRWEAKVRKRLKYHLGCRV